MSEENRESKSTRAPASFRKQWLNPRRPRFWAITLVLVYTLCGFFLVPVLVKKAVVDAARDQFGREARLSEVQFNPYVLSLRMAGFELDDSDGVPLVGFDEFFANLQTSSLFRWAWTFREFRLDGATLNFERFAPGDSRLSRLLADAAERASADEVPVAQSPADERGRLPRLLIHELSISNGRGRFHDQVPRTPLTLEVGPVNVSIQQLNTLPDRHGEQSVAIHLPDGASVKWTGSISLGPLESTGKLNLEGLKLDPLVTYLESMAPISALQATLSSRTNYRLTELADGSLELELDGLETRLENVAASGLEPETEFLTFSSIEVAGGTLAYPANELRLTSIVVSDVNLSAWLDESSSLSLLQLAPEGTADVASEDSSGSPWSTWQIDVDEIRFENLGAHFEDRSISPPARINIHEFDLKLSAAGNEPGRVIPISMQGGLAEGGDFGFEGELKILPAFTLNGAISTRNLPLSLGQSYVEQALNLRIDQGALDLRSEINLQPDQVFIVTGELDILGFKAQDTIENEALSAWNRMNIDRFEIDLLARNAQLSRVAFEGLYGRIEINEDLSTNISSLVKTGESSTVASTESEEPAWSAIVGGIGIDEGSLDFSDLSLPLPFATSISSLDGRISTIATGSTEPANIRLEGQVDEYGLARIDGSMNVLDPIVHTDIAVEFRNLKMSNLSPYSAQFAGRKIDEGQLDLDLGYAIDKGQLQGRNNIVLSDLQLGAEVDSPDAVSLPLGLAVALLTDSNGVIDIDLPVEGDVNDPEFRIGGVVMKAIVGLITKVVAAPFKLLGSLIGVDSEDFGQFQFLAGRADLTPPELEKVAQIKDALAQRPELAIEISGVYDPEIDRSKLQYFRLVDIVYQRLGADAEQAKNDTVMLDDNVRAIVEDLFAVRFPDIPTDSLKAAHTGPPADHPEGKAVLDELAYANELWDRLLVAEQITQADLDALANERADTIANAFLADGEFSETRVIVAEPTEVSSEDGEWVLAELGVASN